MGLVERELATLAGSSVAVVDDQRILELLDVALTGFQQFTQRLFRRHAVTQADGTQFAGTTVLGGQRNVDEARRLFKAVVVGGRGVVDEETHD